MHQNTMSEEVSERVILQRIRNRIMEILEVFSDGGGMEKARDLVEFWADWVESDSPSNFMSPVYTPEEKAAISKVHRAWEEVNISEPVSSDAWLNLNRESKDALKIFRLRGFLSEDVESA